MEVAVGRIWNDTDHLAEFARAGRSYFLEGVAHGVGTIEEGFDEGLVDDGLAGEGVGGVEVAAFEELNLHSAEPAGRDAKKPAPGISGRPGIDGDRATP